MAERKSKSVGACQSLARGLLCRRERRKKQETQRTIKSFQKWKIMIRNPFVLLMLFCFFFLYKTKRNENNIPDAFQNGD